MAEPTKIRAQLIASAPTGTPTSAPTSALVRILMNHDMETGLRSDPGGRPIPAWFIQTVVIRHLEKAVMTLHCGPAVSKNPFFQFTLRNARAGEKVSVQWTDSRGETRSDETTIA
jgi:sulfur-oxidizing protein SoxZ